MSVDESERVVGCEFLYLVRVSRKIKYVTLLDEQIRRCELLVHSADEPVRTGASAELQHIDSIFPINVQVDNCLADSLRFLILNMYTEEIFSHAILFYEVF